MSAHTQKQPAKLNPIQKNQNLPIQKNSSQTQIQSKTPSFNNFDVNVPKNNEQKNNVVNKDKKQTIIKGGKLIKNAANQDMNKYTSNNSIEQLTKQNQNKSQLFALDNQLDLPTIYQKLQSSPNKLNSKDINQIIKNYSMIFEVQRNIHSQLNELKKNHKMVFFQSYKDNQMIENFWYIIYEKLIEKLPISLDSAIKLVKLHLTYNKKKYSQNSEMVKQIISIGKLIVNSSQKLSTAQEEQINLILKGIQLLIQAFMEDMPKIFQLLYINQIHLDIDQGKYKNIRQNMWFSFKTIYKIQNKFELKFKWMTSILKSLLYLSKKKIEIFDQNFTLQFLNFADRVIHFLTLKGKQHCQQVSVTLVILYKSNKQIFQKIKEFKSIQLAPISWLGKIKSRQHQRNKYFQIQGSYWKPLIDQMIQLEGLSDDDNFNEMIIRCVCSILNQHAKQFWENQKQFEQIIVFIRQYFIKIQNYQKLALVMTSAMGQLGQYAFETFQYFSKNIIEIDQKEVYQGFFRKQSMIIFQKSQKLKKDKYNSETNHVIYSFLLKLIKFQPKIILQISDMVEDRPSDIIKQLTINYLDKLKSTDSKQIQSVFHCLQSLLKCKETKQLAQQVITFQQSQSLEKQRLIQKLLQKITDNPDNYSVLSDHILLILPIQNQRKTWLQLMMKLLNNKIQNLDINQLYAYGKVALTYYSIFLEHSFDEKIFHHKKLKSIINQEILLQYFSWCFQMEEIQIFSYYNKLLYRSKFEILKEAIRLLQLILKCIQHPTSQQYVSSKLKKQLSKLSDKQYQLCLNDGKKTSYGTCLVAILCNFNNKQQSLQQYPTIEKQVIQTLILLMNNQNIKELKVYESNYQGVQILTEYCSYYNRLIDYIQFRPSPKGLQLALNFNLLSQQNMFMVVRRLKVSPQYSQEQKLESISLYLIELIDKYKEKSQYLNILDYIFEQLKPFLHKKPKMNSVIEYILDNVWQAFLLAIKDTQLFLNMIERYFPYFFHPYHFRSFSSKYEKLLSIIFSCESFLNPQQLLKIKNNERIFKKPMINFIKNISACNKSQLCLLGCRFLISLFENQLPFEAIQSIQILIENNTNNNNGINQILSALILSKTKNKSLQSFIEEQVQNQSLYSSIVMLFLDNSKNQVKRSALKIAFILFQSNDTHPTQFAAICKFIITLIQKKIFLIEIINFIKKLFKSQCQSHVTIWACTFIYYVMENQKKFISNIAQFFIKNSIIQSRISILLNKCAKITWMGLSHNQKLGLSLIQTTQLLILIKCITVFEIYSQLWRQQNQNIYQALNQSIVIGINSIANLQNIPIVITSEYQAELHKLLVRNLVTKQTSTRIEEQSNNEQQQTTILMVLKNYINTQIILYYMIIVNQAYKQCKLYQNNEDKLLEILKWQSEDIIQYNRNKNKYAIILRNINDKIYSSQKYYQAVRYTNTPLIHFNNLNSYQQLKKATLEQIIKCCQNIKKLLQLNANNNFNKRLQNQMILMKKNMILPQRFITDSHRYSRNSGINSRRFSYQRKQL